MRRGPAKRTGNNRIARGATLPTPVNGWDSASPLAVMDPKFAIVLDNFIPMQSYVQLRNGFQSHCVTGETTPVNTIMSYNAGTASSDKMFAACNDTIYDVTTSTASTTSVTTLTSSQLQWVNFATSAGQFLFYVNGVDVPRYYNGAAWTAPVITGVGLTASDLINVSVFKRRLFFCEANSLSFWFLPVDSVSGVAVEFVLGGVFDQGGYLAASGTMSFDGGAGPDDHCVFITSKGQVAVYAGTDPADPNAWSLVGVYSLPVPVGRRCLTKVAGDLAVVTIGGLLPLSKSLIRDREVSDVALSNRIADQINSAVANYGSNFGWSFTVYPKGHIGILNIPVNEGIQQMQFCINLLSGGWCRFLGQNANCFNVFQDNLYFGGNDGNIYWADSYPTDNGEPITADLKTAFSYFGTRGQVKRFPMMQPVIFSDGRVTPAILLNTDFNDAIPTGTTAGGSLSSTNWDDAEWDVDFWPQDAAMSSVWQTTNAIGQCAAVRMRVIATSTTTLPITLQVQAFNLTFETGSAF